MHPWLARLLLATWLAACAAGALAQSTDAATAEDEPPSTAGVQVLRSAQALLQPEGRTALSRAVRLSHRWDEEFRHTGGTATYTLSLPPRNGTQTMALLFTRVGNQVLAQVNGADVLSRGTLGNPRHDAAKTVHLARVPAQLLRTDGPNELTVRVTVQEARWGGLSTVRYGPEPVLQDEYTRLRQWRHSTSVVFCVGLALMGLMALALWTRLRDPVFACFAAAAGLGILRNLDRVWPDVPVPWPLWGVMVSTAYAWHLALMCLFALLALDLRPAWLRRAILGYLPLALALVVATYVTDRPWIWTATLMLLAPLGIATWLLVARAAVRPGPRRRTAAVLAVAGAAALVTGLHDLGLVHLGLGGPSRFSLTPHAIFLFVVAMAGIIVDRYARSAAKLQALNATLEARIQAKEAELHDAFSQLQAQQAAQATAAERQRIMRDLHDGVGAQLVGLLNLVKQPGTSAAELEEQVKAALDEMRLAVDSMQIGDGDLTTALATLRWRVQPRLQAAGLALHWDVHELPALPGMTPTVVLQVQRIVLEALTNVVKHARAGNVWVNCRAESGAQGVRQMVLEVADDGVGLAGPAQPSPAGGQGVASMQARAASLGAGLVLAARDGGGTVVRLRWPD